MLIYLFLLFAIMPIVEIYVLIQVGTAFGTGTTILLVLLTAAVGASLVRSQGLSTLMSVQRRLNQGEMPGQQIIEGMMLAVAGVLLVTPGFVTDFLGLLILTPATREPIARALLKRMQLRVVQPHNFHHQQGPFNQGPFDQQHNPFEQNDQQPKDLNRGQTIDGDFERKDDKDSK